MAFLYLMIGCIIFVAYIPARFKIESCSIIPLRVDAKVLGSTVFNTFLCPSKSETLTFTRTLAVPVNVRIEWGSNKSTWIKFSLQSNNLLKTDLKFGTKESRLESSFETKPVISKSSETSSFFAICSEILEARIWPNLIYWG